jgi:hypothetical protein
MPSKQQSHILTVYQTHVFAKLHKQIEHRLHKNKMKHRKRKGLNAMTALSMFLVLLTIFLSKNSGDAFMNLSSAAGNLARVNHLIQFVEPMGKPTNEPTIEPAKTQVAYSEPKQDSELPSKINDLTNSQTRGLYHDKNQSRSLLQISLVLNKRSITQLLLQMTISKFGKCQQQSISIPVDCHMQPP